MTNKIAEEIIKLKFDDLTLEKCWKLFTDLMSKYNIKQGDINESGNEVRDRFEWTCYKELFVSQIVSWFNIRNILND